MEYPYYYSANQYYRKLFGKKTYRLSLNGGMTCPNRDGTAGYGGCIFCSEGGSGDFAQSSLLSVQSQIDNAISNVPERYADSSFIAYFQAFTNTYAPTPYLESVFGQAVSDQRISGLAIATRPDCLPDDVIALLVRLSQIKPLWIELGLQTINDTTAELINRGYQLSVFEDTFKKLKTAGIPVTVHVIVGLPGETPDDYRHCAAYLAQKHVHGIKIQLLHVLKGTKLAELYRNGSLNVLTLRQYVSAVADMLELLPDDTVIYRLTGDGPRDILLAPMWSTDKKNVLNSIVGELRRRGTYQGKEYENGIRIHYTI